MKAAIRLTAIALLLVAGLTGCAGFSRNLEVTGETLDATAAQFVAVSEQVTPACNDRTLPAKLCNDFRQFSGEFKKHFPHVVALWKAARAAEDKAMIAAADEVVVALATDLSKLAVDIVRSFMPKQEAK